MQSKRGEIQYPERARQLRDFSGLLFGSITPTDIDGLIEYHDKGYILIETKFDNAPLLYGQKLALERMADDLSKANKTTICIIAKHDVENPEENIDVANTIVQEYRFRNSWHVPKKEITTKQAIAKFISIYIDGGEL